ncbi:MAG: polymorphic toxin-type HINT domain-containing protein [Methyloligellaceae bacterium]
MKCSFYGDTNVLTRNGYRKIRSIKANKDFVWARNEYTGKMDWKRVLGQNYSKYDHRLHITIRDMISGEIQTIVSNRIHRFYVSKGSVSLQLVVNSSGMTKGTNATGKWIEAQYLKPGYRLLNGDASHSEIISVKLEKKNLTAYNLHVDGFHTFFVRGAANENAKPVWVHNHCHQIDIVIKKFRGQNFKFGGNVFKLDKKGLKHILTRHHPNYWDKTSKPKQTFFSKKMSVKDIENAIKSVMKQNRATLLSSSGTREVYQIEGSYKGTKYVLGVNQGRIGQFYPK